MGIIRRFPSQRVLCLELGWHLWSTEFLAPVPAPPHGPRPCDSARGSLLQLVGTSSSGASLLRLGISRVTCLAEGMLPNTKQA